MYNISDQAESILKSRNLNECNNSNVIVYNKSIDPMGYFRWSTMPLFIQLPQVQAS